MSKVLIFLVFCAVLNDRHHVKAQQNILEQGKIAVLGAIAKGKEVLDHGVNVKSERQQSYDIFGLKFGTNNGIGTGFGDAATEKNLNSVEDDLVRRRRRSLDVLAALRAAGLFSTSAGGTNVNIVKINSVSNVNNYEPQTSTESSRRRRKSIGNIRGPLVFSTMDQKVSFVTSDTELHKDETFESRKQGESLSNHLEKVEVDKPAIRNRRSIGIDKIDQPQEPVKMERFMQNNDKNLFLSRRTKRSLVLTNLEDKFSYFTSDSEAKADGSIKTHTFAGSRQSKLRKLSIDPESEGGHRRSKRSPQETDEGTGSTDLPPRNGTRPGPPDGDRGGPPSGRPRGPPPGCGGGGGGGGGPGGGPGRGRGPPPPPSEENDSMDQPSDATQRKKRETDDHEDSNQSNSSYYSDSSSGEEGTGQRRRKRDNIATDSSDSSVSSYYSDSYSSEYSDSTSEEDQSSESNDGGEVTQDADDLQRTKRSPCKKGNRSTTLPPDQLERRKREAESQEDAGRTVEKDVSWFSDVMDKFFRVVKKVADTAKQVFRAGKEGDDGEANRDAEQI